MGIQNIFDCSFHNFGPAQSEHLTHFIKADEVDALTFVLNNPLPNVIFQMFNEIFLS
jgi:hypothetical protein